MYYYMGWVYVNKRALSLLKKDSPAVSESKSRREITNCRHDTPAFCQFSFFKETLFSLRRKVAFFSYLKLLGSNLLE